MGGKATILLVLGFTAVFSMIGNNLNTISSRAIDNMADYYEESAAKNIAVIGANMAANEMFLDGTWSDSVSGQAVSGGLLDVEVTTINAFQNIRQIRSVGSFNNVTREVKIIFQPSKFSKFAYYCENEPTNIWWITGDTVWGPMHVQTSVRVAGRPVFMGKVTAKQSLVKYNSSADPKFYGSYEEGIDLPIPSDGVSNLKIAAQTGGFVFTNKDIVYMRFNGDMLEYKFNAADSYISVNASTLAPNGVIFVEGADIRLEGRVEGQYTIGTSDELKTITTTYVDRKGKIRTKTETVDVGGSVYLDDDIVYNSDPRTNPGTQDLLGIVAENSTYITDNVANRSDINIHAAIYCESGGFGAENYADRPVSGKINLLGGITQSQRLAVGTFNSSGIVSGFSKRYKYDNRLMVASPPAFPGTGSFEIVSWYE